MLSSSYVAGRDLFVGTARLRPCIRLYLATRKAVIWLLNNAYFNMNKIPHDSDAIHVHYQVHSFYSVATNKSETKWQTHSPAPP